MKNQLNLCECVLFMNIMICASKKGMEKDWVYKVEGVEILWNTIDGQIFRFFTKIFFFFKSTVGFVLNFNQPQSMNWKAFFKF